MSTTANGRCNTGVINQAVEVGMFGDQLMGKDWNLGHNVCVKNIVCGSSNILACLLQLGFGSSGNNELFPL